METRMQRQVRVIPPTKPRQAAKPRRTGKLRVAAYCRVSTDTDEQINSYKAQKRYYTQLISENSKWAFGGLFADEGLSGTSMKNRTEFNRMMAACKRGRIDMILVKSISRFARNTVDCLESVRKLRTLGISVKFEKENIDTLTEPSEFMIALHSSFAQAESESISKNVTWGIRKSMEAGNVPMQYSTLLGYRKGADGLPEIVPEEAETVRQIYRKYLGGASLQQIKTHLEAKEILTARGGTIWSVSAIRNILTNEKYIGDALLQKTFTADCISKKVYKNNGELPMYYVENHHPAIIPKVVFQKVQEEIARRSSKRKIMQKSAKTEQGKYSAKYALTERLICGECGSPYKRCTWTQRGQKRIVWRCVSRLEYGKKYCHNSPTIDEPELHKAILAAINNYADTQRAKDIALQCAEEAIGECKHNGVNIAELRARLENVKSQQDVLLDKILADMNDQALIDKMQMLETAKQEVQSQIQRYEDAEKSCEKDKSRSQELQKLLKEHPAGLSEYDDHLVRKTVKEIRVLGKERMEVQFYGDEKKNTQSI